MNKFTGIIPALVTPLKEDETLNVPVLCQLMESLVKEGAKGFYIGGATGEGIALQREVREQLAEEAISFAKGKVPSIIHIASIDFNEALELAKHAEKCGADAISAIPPLFFSYDEDDVYQYYKALADAVHIPVMIYFNPAAGFSINAEFAARMFEVDNITAIKWTSSDYYGMMRLKDLTHGEMNIINGPDEMLLMGLNAGADGGIGTTYNLILPRIKAIYDNFMAGNLWEAQQAQMKANRVIAVLKKYEIIPCVKAMLKCKGFDVGDSVFPMKKYEWEEGRRIWEELVEAGI